MKNILVGIAFAFAIGLQFWQLITPDALALGLNEHIVNIVDKLFTTGTSSAATLAAFFHIALPALNKKQEEPDVPV